MKKLLLICALLSSSAFAGQGAASLAESKIKTYTCSGISSNGAELSPLTVYSKSGEGAVELFLVRFTYTNDNQQLVAIQDNVDQKLKILRDVVCVEAKSFFRK